MPTTCIEADHDYYEALANRFFELCDMYQDGSCACSITQLSGHTNYCNDQATAYACTVLYTELGVHTDEVMYAISYEWLAN